MKVVLINPYEIGRQPFGLAEPAAWLKRAGCEVHCLDLTLQRLDPEVLRGARLVAIYVAMHTATRIAMEAIPRVLAIVPGAHLCVYGLYAPMNEKLLRDLGAQTVLGGEVEPALVSLVERLRAGESAIATHQVTGRKPQTGLPWPATLASIRSATSEGANGPSLARALRFNPLAEASRASVTSRGCRTRVPGVPPISSPIGDGQVQTEPVVNLSKIEFMIPDRASLPPLERYAHLQLPDGSRKTVGFAEGSRGCKHLCRHCPVVPVYQGAFRVIPVDTVMADVRQQVAAGARHISFGDPDFLNGPTHAHRLVQALHAEFPNVSYDATIKIQHLIDHAQMLPELKSTGCLFITAAVESVDDRVLDLLAKNHTNEDFARAVALCRAAGIALAPTFVAFTPWTTLEGYIALLQRLLELDLVESVPPIQLAIRLLIPQGSLLLELTGFQALIGEFDPRLLGFPWANPDPRVDRLQLAVQQQVVTGEVENISRRGIFASIWKLAHEALGVKPPELADSGQGMPIPRLSEPWYCCAEPTHQQLQSF